MYILYGLGMNELKLYIDKVGVPAFAEKMGVSKELVYKVLRGERGISKKFAEKAELASGGFIKKEKLLWGEAA